MRISSNQFHETGLNAILRQQAAVSESQERVATGKRLLSAADDPVASTSILRIRQEISSLQNFQGNVNFAEATLQTSEDILSSVNDVLIRVRQLAIQANNTTLSSNDRESIAVELDERLAELLSLANTRTATGEYLFSGFASNTQAVKLDSNNNYIYQGDEGVRLTKIGLNAEVTLNHTAKELFFDVSANGKVLTGFTGRAQVVTSASGLVNSGSLPTLDANDLILNNQNIAAATADGVSTTDASASAIAIAAAINANTSAHGVVAQANSNIFNLGAATLGTFNAGDFTINGSVISGVFATNTDLLNAINAETINTGVVATDVAGDIILTAPDGRNIQLQTDGTTGGPTFANFDLDAGGGAVNQVQRAGVTIYDENPFTVGGGAVADVGLTLGTVTVSANGGTGVLSTPIINNPPLNSPETYHIVFNNPPTTFDVYADSNPTTPLAGFDDVAYIAGETITIDGIEFNISGAPNAGDSFVVDIEDAAKQSIFQTIEDIITAVRGYGGDIDRRSYEIGVGLNNLRSAEDAILRGRAEIGARLNIVTSQQGVNTDNLLTAQTFLSRLEDLDYAEGISILQQQSFALEAAQASFARIQGLSLFNFIS